MIALEILFAGIVIGAVAAFGIAILRDRPHSPAHWTGALFALSVMAYALNIANGLPPAQPIGMIVQTLSWAGAAYFWLFAVTLFSDKPFNWLRLWPVALLTAVALAGISTPRSISGAIWIGHNLIEAALGAHILWTIWRSAGGDLVEARRSVRAPFFAASVIYTFAQSGVEIVNLPRNDSAGANLVLSIILAGLSVVGVSLFVRLRGGLFTESAPRVAAVDDSRIPPQDRPLAVKLAAAMEAGAWRTEGLTIGALAADLGAPEHRLRKLINDGLGYRNFADFLNARRIDAAKAALADPARARDAVSTIAFDLGYASLGPFNRAFKEATGQTPSEWRKIALSAAPIPKNPL